MTSAPVPIDHMIGIRPIMAAATVIIFGPDALDRAVDDRLVQISQVRSRPAAPSPRRTTRSRNSSMKTPVSASSPIRAIMPTQAAIEML